MVWERVCGVEVEGLCYRGCGGSVCVSGGRRRLIFGDEGLRINPPSVQEVRSLCMSIMY